MDIRQYEASVHYLGIEANVYLAKDVDEYFAKMTKNNFDYAKKILEGVIELKDENEKLKAENAELKKKLEDVQASHYAEMVDAGMRERRLKRALFIAHAIKAKFKWWWITECKHNESCKILPDPRKIKKFTNTAWVCSKSQEKCRAKAEEYK